MLNTITRSHFSSKKAIMLMLLMTGFIFATNPILNIQGILRDSDGKAVTDGNYQLSFYLYDAETGGSSIWNETHSSVSITNGVYSASIGAATSLGGLAFDVPYYLGISVNGGDESTPRIPLSNTPYALSMRGVDNVFPSSGNVGVGAPLPNIDLAIGDNDTGFDYSEDNGHSLKVQIGNEEIVAIDDSGLVVFGRVQDKTGYVSPVGSVIAFAGSTAPGGWLLCDGSGYSSANYPDLYAVIGTSYGSTSGNFLVPDLRTRVPVGLSSSNTQFQEIGDVGGEVEHTLSVEEMPNHDHVMHAQGEVGGYGYLSRGSRAFSGGGGAWFGGSGTIDGGMKTGFNGADSSHNNMPPFVVMNYIIKY